MPEYRAYTVGSDGHYKSSQIIVADNDADAIRAAGCLGRAYGVELWILDRKIAVLPPKANAS